MKLALAPTYSHKRTILSISFESHKNIMKKLIIYSTIVLASLLVQACNVTAVNPGVAQNSATTNKYLFDKINKTAKSNNSDPSWVKAKKSENLSPTQTSETCARIIAAIGNSSRRSFDGYDGLWDTWTYFVKEGWGKINTPIRRNFYDYRAIPLELFYHLIVENADDKCRNFEITVNSFYYKNGEIENKTTYWSPFSSNVNVTTDGVFGQVTMLDNCMKDYKDGKSPCLNRKQDLYCYGQTCGVDTIQNFVVQGKITSKQPWPDGFKKQIIAAEKYKRKVDEQEAREARLERERKATSYSYPSSTYSGSKQFRCTFKCAKEGINGRVSTSSFSLNIESTSSDLARSTMRDKGVNICFQNFESGSFPWNTECIQAQ